MAAIELGCPYYVYTPSQANKFTLNAPADPDFVGYVDDITGLDMAGIRENAQVVVAGDGGYHGPFWRDRRPWTFSGFIVPSFALMSRDASQEKIEGIIGQAMQSDGYLTWTPADAIQRMLKFRAQQPVRITTGQSKVEKKFQVACVTADFRVLAWNLSSVSVSGVTPISTPTATNLGNADASPIFTITGPITNPVITNTTTGKKLTFSGSVPALGTYPTGTFTIDLTGAYPVINNSGTDWSGYMDPLNSDWSISVAGIYSVANGNNVFQLTGSGASSGTALQVQWRHSWV